MSEMSHKMSDRTSCGTFPKSHTQRLIHHMDILQMSDRLCKMSYEMSDREIIRSLSEG
jgi:hypothetical protein